MSASVPWLCNLAGLPFLAQSYLNMAYKLTFLNFEFFDGCINFFLHRMTRHKQSINNYICKLQGCLQEVKHRGSLTSFWVFVYCCFQWKNNNDKNLKITLSLNRNSHRNNNRNNYPRMLTITQITGSEIVQGFLDSIHRAANAQDSILSWLCA